MIVKPLVLVTTSFPITGDGSEAAGSFVADLVEELATHGPVRVVAPGEANQLQQWGDNIEVFRFAAPDKPLSTLRPWRPGDLYDLTKVLRGGQVAVDRAVAGGAGQILALWGLPSGEWARRASRRSGIHYSVWLLGSDVWSLGRLPIVRAMLARVIRGARVAWADGYQLAADAGRIAGRKVDFLPTTRRIDTVNPLPPRVRPPYRLLFLGRWHPNKGIDLLLDALAMLNDEDWGYIETVEIQGGGPMHQLVHARVKRLQDAGRPIEIGAFLAKPEAEAAIVRADWVLIPSRIESIPVVFSDAVKLGRPVVAMPVGDLPVLLANEPCGVLAAITDAAAFCVAVRSALHGSPQAFNRGVRAQAARFDLALVAHDFQRRATNHA